MMGSTFQPAATLPILVFLQIIHWVTGQYNLIPPDNPVIGIVGNRAILPCQLQGKIILEKLSVQWIFSGGSTERQVATFDGKILQNPILEFEAYRGRTEFFPLEVLRGNVSLLLKSVHPSDKGKYICVVFLETWYSEVVVDLDVAAQGAESSLFLDGHTGSGIGLSCRSQGWFPAPSVLWLDSQGRMRLEEETTRSTPNPSSGIFDVVSSMSLELGSDREVSCRVVNEVLNATRESRVRIADSFFPSTFPSPWMFASLAILGLDLGVVGAFLYKMKRTSTQTRNAEVSRMEAGTERLRVKSELERERETNKAAMLKYGIKLERLKLELDFWDARSHVVPVALDPKVWALNLGDAKYPRLFLVLVAKDALGAGKHYWEVELGRKLHWGLGVLWDRLSPPGPHSLDSQDFWAMLISKGKLISSSYPKDWKPRKGLSVVGVFLDSEEERLEFYDVEKMHLLVGLSLPAGKDPTGKFFPFVSQWRKGTLQIHPVPIPVPL